MNLYFIQYANMMIVLWNYPPIFAWSLSHYLYLVGTWIYTMAYTYYQYNVEIFLTDENVKKQYANVLRFHIIRTISTSLHSYLSVISVYLLQKETAPFLLFMSLYIHMIINYLYYFKEVNPYVALMKHIPHMVDTIIIIGCIPREKHVYFRLGTFCIARILSEAFVYNKLLSQIFLCAETYYIVKSLL